MRLEIDDEYGMIYSHFCQKLNNGLIHVGVIGFDRSFCQYFPESSIHKLTFYNEIDTILTCSVELVIPGVDICAEYERYDSYEDGWYKFLYIMKEDLK